MITEGSRRTEARAETAGRMEGLYRAHAADALRLAYLLTGDVGLAEDLMQDAFVRVFGRFRDIRERDAFWFYLRRTIVNLSNSHFRRKRVERAWLERQRPEEGVPPADVAERERLRAALALLRPEQRAAVVLRFYEDLSEVDTARVLDCPVGTVKSMVSRAMDRLRAEIEKE